MNKSPYAVRAAPLQSPGPFSLATTNHAPERTVDCNMDAHPRHSAISSAASSASRPHNRNSTEVCLCIPAQVLNVIMLCRKCGNHSLQQNPWPVRALFNGMAVFVYAYWAAARNSAACLARPVISASSPDMNFCLAPARESFPEEVNGRLFGGTSTTEHSTPAL